MAIDGFHGFSRITRHRAETFACLAGLCSLPVAAQTEVTGFGSNPGAFA